MDVAARKLYEMKARVIAAAAHPVRLAILDCLCDGERCVCDLAASVQAGRANVSRHLAVMLKAGLVECRKDGLKVIYSLKAPCVRGFADCVAEVLRHQARETASLLRKLK
jgi:ArsR family transcriptional regulator